MTTTDAHRAYEAIEKWVESCEWRVASFLSESAQLRNDIAQAFASIPLGPGQQADWIRCDIIVPADMAPGHRITVDDRLVSVNAVSTCWNPDGEPVIVPIADPEQLSVWETLSALLDNLNADFPLEAHSLNRFIEASLAITRPGDQAQLQFGSLAAAHVEIDIPLGLADDYAERDL